MSMIEDVVNSRPGGGDQLISINCGGVNFTLAKSVWQEMINQCNSGIDPTTGNTVNSRVDIDKMMEKAGNSWSASQIGSLAAKERSLVNAMVSRINGEEE